MDAMAVKQQQQHGCWFKLRPVPNVLLRFLGWTTCFLKTVCNAVSDTFSCLVGVSIHMYICIDILYLSVVWKRLQSGLQSSEESCTLSWTHLSVCFEVKYFDETLLKQFRMTKLAFQMLWNKIGLSVGPVLCCPIAKPHVFFDAH